MPLILNSTILGTSFTGTASLATQAVSSSYSEFAVSSSYFSGSVEFATSASLAATASFLSGSIESASYAATASYALTASYISGGLSGEGFPFTGSAAISGTLSVSKNPDTNVLGKFTTLVAGEGLIADSNVNIATIAFGQYNRTGSTYSNNSSSFVVGIGFDDINRKNLLDYRYGSPDTFIIGNPGLSVNIDTYVTRITRRDPVTGFVQSGSFIIDNGIETTYDGVVKFNNKVESSASIDISGSLLATEVTANTASFVYATGSFRGLSISLSGSFTGSYTGSFEGTWNGTGSAAFLHTGSEGYHQAITGSVTIFGGLNVIGSASFTYVTSSNLLVDDNTITVFADSVGGINTAGLVATDSASLSNSGSLLYDITTQKWNADRDFVIPAVTASNAIYIGDGTTDQTFRIIPSGSNLIFQIWKGSDWNNMATMSE